MKVQVRKSVEGGSYRVVQIEKELMDSLIRFDQVNNTFTFLFVNGMLKMDDDLSDKLLAIIEECKLVFRKYNLDKYDIRAHYKWNDAKLLETETLN